MRITAIDWYLVNQFVHEEMVNSPEYRAEEEKWDAIPKILVVVHTDEGVSGLGETPRGVSVDALVREAKELLGRDPLQLELAALPISAAIGGVYQAFEAALVDLVGKIRGVSACELLGGRLAERVRVSYWAGRQTPEHSVRTARAALEKGYTCLKIKAKQGDPLVERVRAMYEAAPELKIIIDPMQRYDDVDEVIRIAKALEAFNVLCLEDPLPKSNLENYQKLHRETSIPLALHVGTMAQMEQGIEAGCISIFNCSPRSMFTFVAMVNRAQQAGIPCWHGSGVDLGILDASYLHSAAAAPNCSIPSDILSTPLHLDDFIVEAPQRSGEWMSVPTGPGLGCELDMDAVNAYLIEKGRVGA